MSLDLHNKPEENVRNKYRAIFLSPMGLDVLADILQVCHFGCTLDPDNKVQVSEHNVGVMILAKCGVFSEDRLQDAIRALCSMPTIKQKEVEE
jgi:hypothetical protein